jgi:hypothetical protein
VYGLSKDMNGSGRFLRGSLCVLVLSAALDAQHPESQTPAPNEQNATPKPPTSESPAANAPAEAASTLELPPTNDPREIVRRAIETDHHALEFARQYTHQERQVIKHLGRHGEVKSTEIKTYDVTYFYGEQYHRLIAVDDKPLSDKEQKKEDEKLEKFLAKFRTESESDREKRLEKERKQREEGRAFVHDVVNAYDFRLVGEEKVGGAETWVIEGTPRPDFQPTRKDSEMLRKIKGRLWIEKKDFNWIKVEAEATDTIAFGVFLFRIHPGSHFVLERGLVNSEVWLLKRLYIQGGARIAVLKNENVEQEDVASNFKKFVTSVKILPGVKEVPQENAPK